MSWEATRWAWQASTEGGLARYVLLALADYASSKDASCYPSLGEIAAKTGLGTSTVRRLLRQLEAEGLINVKVTSGGRHARSDYRLMVKSESETQPERAGNDSVVTRPERAGKTQKTRPARSGKDTKTQPERAGKKSETQPERRETQPERAENPTRAGDVVPTTSHRTNQEPTTIAADAAPKSRPRTNGALALVPSDPVPAVVEVNAGHVAAAWIDTYRRERPGVRETNQQKLQAARESRQLIEAGNDPARVLAAAQSAAAKGYATVQREFSMLAARNGRVQLAAGQIRPSTTDIRVNQTLALMDNEPEEIR